MPLQSTSPTVPDHRPVRRLWHMVTLSMAASLTACGGGSSFGPTPEPVVPETTIVGVVAKGRVSGASVCAYRITDGKQGAQLGPCTTTDADGNFTISFRDYAGEAIVQAKGGTYRDEASGANRALTTLRAIRPGNLLAINDNEVNITPLTELAVRRADLLGAYTKERIMQATNEVRQRFGNFDLHTTTPSDLMSDTGFFPEYSERAYGLALAGFSGYVYNKGGAATLDSVLEDFAKKIAANTLGSETTAFRSGITTFLGSAQNASSLTAAMAGSLISLNFGAGSTTTQSIAVSEPGEKCLVGSLKLGFLGANAVCWFNMPNGRCNAASLELATARILVQYDPSDLSDTPSNYTAVKSCSKANQRYSADFVSGTVYLGDPF